MMAITHLTTSLAVGSLPLMFGYTTDYGNEMLCYLGAVAFGATVIDIDEPASAFGRRLLPISIVINKAFGHRTITHNLIIAVIGMVVSLMYKNFIMFGFFFGVSVHILGDAMTGNVRGALAPFSARFYLLPQKMIFRVGSISEHVILAVSMLLLFGEHALNIKKVIM